MAVGKSKLPESVEFFIRPHLRDDARLFLTYSDAALYYKQCQENNLNPVLMMRVSVVEKLELLNESLPAGQNWFTCRDYLIESGENFDYRTLSRITLENQKPLVAWICATGGWISNSIDNAKIRIIPISALKDDGRKAFYIVIPDVESSYIRFETNFEIPSNIPQLNLPASVKLETRKD